MIYCLTGKIIKKTMNAVVVSCGGVGYYAQCPASVAGALPGVGKETTLYTVMSVTENDVSLYGFATEEQQACFEMLTAVSGVGPKVGLAHPERDGAGPGGAGHLGRRPQGVQGGFRCGAQAGPAHCAGTERQGSQGLCGRHQPGRRSRSHVQAPAAQGAGQAIAALVSLGYSQSEAAMAVSKIDATLPVEEIIKLALRGMAGRR